MSFFLKRFLCVFLCLLFFTSCTEKSEKTEDTVPPEVTDVSEKPLAFRLGGELPDIGKFSGARPEHFHGGYTDDFIPSDRYGLLIPYIGKMREFSTTGDWKITQDYAAYGLCTPDGKIVLDASFRNNYISYSESDDGFGYYILSRDIEGVSDAPDEYMPSETLLIPKSGEWCIKVDRDSYVSFASDGVICIQHYTMRTAELYDYDGNFIVEITDADGIGKCAAGLMDVHCWDDKDAQNTLRFINKEGTTVFGPYRDGSGFNSFGVASVCDLDGIYKLINTKGEAVTDKAYTSISSTWSDYGAMYAFIASEGENGEKDIYNGKGEFIGRISRAGYVSLRFPTDDDLVYMYSNLAGDPVAKRLSDGEMIVSKEYGVSPNSYSSTDDIYIYTDSNNKFMLLMDYMGNTVAAFDNSTDFISFIGGKYIAYATGSVSYSTDTDGDTVTESDRMLHIYDKDAKKELFKAVGGGGYAEYYDDRYIFICAYDETDFFGGKSKYYLYDTEKDEMLFEECRLIYAYCINGEYYYAVSQENKCVLYDSKMNAVLKSFEE